MSRLRRRDDDGFTLIDTLIAVVIMGSAIVVLISALAGLITQTQYHRGNAVAETTARSLGEAVQAEVRYRTKVVQDNGAQITVADASGFPATRDFYVAIDQEMILVTGLSTNTLTVTRGAAMDADPSSVAVHAANSVVVIAYRCPTAADFAPDASMYAPAPGVTAQVSAVEHLDPATQVYTDTATCQSTYDAACTYRDGSDNPHPDVRLECDGVHRLTLSVTATDSRLRDAVTTTKILVRQGSF